MKKPPPPRKQRLRDGRTVYRLRVPQPDRSFKIQQFANRQDADAEHQRLCAEIDRYGAIALRLDDMQRLEAARAIDILRRARIRRPLDEVVREYVEGVAQAPAKVETFDSAYPQFLLSKQGTVTSHAIVNLTGRMRWWARAFGARPVSSLTPAELEQHLRKKGVAPASMASYRAALVTFYEWAIKRGMATSNPAKAIQGLQVKRQSFTPIPAAELTKLLRHLETTDRRVTVALAIRAFAGLRTSELGDRYKTTGLRWRDIDLTARHIHVRPDLAKCQIERWVPIEDNLVAWLAKYLPQDLDESLFVWPEVTAKAVAGSGVALDRNILRKSYASYHMKLYGDPGRTAMNLGHQGNLTTTFRHYARAVRDREDAEDYFGILPRHA